MLKWMLFLGVGYILALFTLAIISKRSNRGTADFILAGSNIGLILGFMSFAATLFSTFTLMGMPDFFRVHGVGAWNFLAFSDAAMVFFVLIFGYHLRKKVSSKGFKGISSLLQQCYNNKWAGYVYFCALFFFLIPYVSIQIRGIAIFLYSAFPDFLSIWGWSIAMVAVILAYSSTGGLKAIMYADVLQGVILMLIVWLIAMNCIQHFGSVPRFFEEVGKTNEELLSIPGPRGLFGFQFLLASLLAIVCIPITQPQLSTRIIIMKDFRTMQRMAIAVGCFAMLIILPTLIIGFYGAVLYPDHNTADFLTQVLLFDQSHFLAAAAVIGLIAAALSTSDSQLFAMGSEIRSLTGEKWGSLKATRLWILFFAVAALVFANIADDRLVMLARVSFAGTGLTAPMIVIAVVSNHAPPRSIIWITGLAIFVFLASLVGWIPDHIGPVRMDLSLLTIVALFSITATWVSSRARVSS